MVSFNPVNVNHWLKKRFFDKKDKKAKVLKTTYKDNKFIEAEYKEKLEAFKETDPYYYAVYCLGEWGVYGKTIFNALDVQKQLDKKILPLTVGYFDFDYDGKKITNIKFVPDKDGFIYIYKKPEKGIPYVVGGDTAGEGSDNFTAQVLDNTTKEQVCVLINKFDEDLYAKQLYCLGVYYNKALLAPETNYSTYPVKELERLRYPKLFVRMREDTYTHKTVKAYGFQTNSVTRPIIISELVKVMREKPELVIDDATLFEMLTFVRNEKGRPEAQQGAHDDLIMALAIAHYASDQQTTAVISSEPEKNIKWTKDMYEDYKKQRQE